MKYTRGVVVDKSMVIGEKLGSLDSIITVPITLLYEEGNNNLLSASPTECQTFFKLNENSLN